MRISWPDGWLRLDIPVTLLKFCTAARFRDTAVPIFIHVLIRYDIYVGRHLLARRPQEIAVVFHKHWQQNCSTSTLVSRANIGSPRKPSILLKAHGMPFILSQIKKRKFYTCWRMIVERKTFIYNFAVWTKKKMLNNNRILLFVTKRKKKPFALFSLHLE